MKTPKCFLQASGDFLRDDSGQDLMEYALVAAIIAVGVIASLQSVRTAILGAFNSISTVMSTI